VQPIRLGIADGVAQEVRECAMPDEGHIVVRLQQPLTPNALSDTILSPASSWTDMPRNPGPTSREMLAWHVVKLRTAMREILT
jgi:hypothetical protein